MYLAYDKLFLVLPLAVVVGLLAVALVGLINGLITVYLGVSSLITTLGMFFLLAGLNVTLTGGFPAVTPETSTLTQVLGEYAWAGTIWALIIIAVLQLSTSKIYLRDATITLRSTYGRRRRATATDRTGCLPESQSASARPGIAPLCSRRECRADHLIHRSEQGEHPARPRPLPAAGFRGTGRWECSGQSAAYHPRGEGFHAGEAHGGGSHVERHPTDRDARRALRHRGYARGCTSAAPLDGLLVEAHPLCAK